MKTNIKELLQDLKDTKLVKVTGSFADGTQTKESDIDFYVKEDKPDRIFSERNILKIKEVLDKHEIKMQSDMIGYLYSHKSDNDLPIQIEFSDLFTPRKNKLKKVTIYEVEFNTH